MPRERPKEIAKKPKKKKKKKKSLSRQACCRYSEKESITVDLRSLEKAALELEWPGEKVEERGDLRPGAVRAGTWRLRHWIYRWTHCF